MNMENYMQRLERFRRERDARGWKKTEKREEFESNKKDARDEPEREPNVFIPSEEIKVDEVGRGGEVEFAFQKNPCLDGHPREEGLEDCVIKKAAVTSNKSEIGRWCNCSPRTVYRILVEEEKQEDVIDVEADFCEQCGEAFVEYEDEDGTVVCSNCGWRR